MYPNKEQIIEMFNANVRGRRPDVVGGNLNHDGRQGHWLERAMGLTPNRVNEADIGGYEMKTQTRGKTTWGDWVANKYIWQEKYTSVPCRDVFMELFGHKNAKKGGRLSWSGTPVPTFYKVWTPFGQVMDIDDESNIIIYYRYDKDARSNKDKIIPSSLRHGEVRLAIWEVRPSSGKSIKRKLEDKWNQSGFFRCKISSGVYSAIEFGPPITFPRWIELIKAKSVFFDSGMHQGNSRPYSQWRSSNSFWDSFINESF